MSLAWLSGPASRLKMQFRCCWDITSSGSSSRSSTGWPCYPTKSLGIVPWSLSVPPGTSVLLGLCGPARCVAPSTSCTTKVVISASTVSIICGNLSASISGHLTAFSRTSPDGYASGFGGIMVVWLRLNITAQNSVAGTYDFGIWLHYAHDDGIRMRVYSVFLAIPCSSWQAVSMISLPVAFCVV